MWSDAVFRPIFSPPVHHQRSCTANNILSSFDCFPKFSEMGDHFHKPPKNPNLIYMNHNKIKMDRHSLYILDIFWVHLKLFHTCNTEFPQENPIHHLIIIFAEFAPKTQHYKESVKIFPSHQLDDGSTWYVPFFQQYCTGCKIWLSWAAWVSSGLT